MIVSYINKIVIKNYYEVIKIVYLFLNKILLCDHNNY